MPDNVTITGKIGPNLTVTSRLFSPARAFHVNFAGQVLSIEAENKTFDFDLFTIQTISYTVATHIGTVTFS